MGEYEYVNPAQAAQYYAQQQQLQMQGYTGADSADFDSSGGEALMAQGFRILKEELPPDYEPSHEEIVQYAEYLGMDPIADKDLLYIAKEGLKAPLPAPWKPCQQESDDQIYYYNFETRELQQEHPCDDFYKKNFLQEKALKQRKQEEAAIKKHLKQQQKAQQQAEIAAGLSVGSN